MQPLEDQQLTDVISVSVAGTEAFWSERDVVARRRSSKAVTRPRTPKRAPIPGLLAGSGLAGWCEPAGAYTVPRGSGGVNPALPGVVAVRAAAARSAAWCAAALAAAGLIEPTSAVPRANGTAATVTRALRRRLPVAREART
ncbi:MAG: hypothetical protein ACLPQS_04195 [Acidimicrobiales bacterium]